MSDIVERLGAERLCAECDCRPLQLAAKAEIKRLQVVLDSRDMEIEKHLREIERLQAVINEYEQDRLSRLGGIGSPA